MSQALRKMTSIINKSNCAVVFINQLREKIGVMYGNPEVTTGGRALKFYSSMRMEVRRIETIKSGDQMLGNRTKVKIVKNKVAPPFKQAEFDIMYGKGISKEGDIVDCAAAMNVIDKAGSWYSFEGERIGQGRENVKNYFMEHPEIMKKVENMVLDVLKKEKEEKKKESSRPKVDEDGVVIE